MRGKIEFKREYSHEEFLGENCLCLKLEDQLGRGVFSNFTMEREIKLSEIRERFKGMKKLYFENNPYGNQKER